MQSKNDHTLHAQEVLDDAMSAIVKWSWGPIEEGAESRVIYAAAVSLLRAVGHVLHKVDCQNFPVIKDDVDQRFKRWKQGKGKDLIFVEFIEKERNLILKEYAPNWRPDNEVTFALEVREIPKERANSSRVSEHSQRLTDAMTRKLKGKTFKAVVMPSGPFAGHDFGDLLFRAARWWSRELSEIEKIAVQK